MAVRNSLNKIDKDMEIEEIKVCKGCSHILGDDLGDTAMACCPDGNFVPLKEFISELWKDAYNSGTDNRKTIKAQQKDNEELREELEDVLKSNKGLRHTESLLRESNVTLRNTNKKSKELLIEWSNQNTELKKQVEVLANIIKINFENKFTLSRSDYNKAKQLLINKQ